MSYILINLTHREFGQPKPLKRGEVPPPSHFAGGLLSVMALADPEHNAMTLYYHALFGCITPCYMALEQLH